MRFDECLPYILKFEGGYTFNPNDRGGSTNKGITQRNYDAWRSKQNLPMRPVQEITDDEVRSIYLTEYWAKASCPLLPSPVDLVVFDSAVNCGTGRAVKWLQKAVGVKEDGAYGAKTNAAVLLHGAMETALEILNFRDDFYEDIIDHDPSQLVFRNGWHNRIDKLRTEITHVT